DFSEEGARLQKEADQYRSDILASMDKATISQNGLNFIPMDLTETKPYENLTQNGHATYYNILSCRMLESEIFDIDDERLQWIPAFLEGSKGIMLGITRFSGSNKLGFTAHFSAGYGLANLRMGKIDRSLLN